MSHSNSTKAVVIALSGNALISILKFVAGFFTMSASMLAEAIHSTADCFNQIFLLIGNKRSQKSSDENHPFGYGREEFFWAFIVAIMLFFGGAAFSIYEGIHKLSDPQPIEHIWWGIAILGISAIIEYKSFMVAYREFTKEHEDGLVRGIKESINVNLIVILLEDAAALVGLVVALVCTLLSLINPVFDAIGSILIGGILAFVSYSLVNELRKFIIGESMPRVDRNRIKEIINDFEIVTHVNRIKTMTMGRNQYMVLISINIDDFERGYNIEDMVDAIKTEIQSEFPEVNELFIEISEK